jgi:hypothetical protein
VTLNREKNKENCYQRQKFLEILLKWKQFSYFFVFNPLAVVFNSSVFES